MTTVRYSPIRVRQTGPIVPFGAPPLDAPRGVASIVPATRISELTKSKGRLRSWNVHAVLVRNVFQ